MMERAVGAEECSRRRSNKRMEDKNGVMPLTKKAPYKPHTSRIGIEHDGCALDGGRELREQFQPLAPGCRWQVAEAGDIPSRAGQARNEPGADRVAHEHKHNRDCPRLA